jgi:hypothetical protein
MDEHYEYEMESDTERSQDLVSDQDSFIHEPPHIL